MMTWNEYNTKAEKRKDMKKLILVIVELALIVLIALSVIWMLQTAGLAEESERFILCKPADFILVRYQPDKNSEEVGYLECGDSFLTDGKEKNGFLHVLHWGESGDGWVFAGYVVEEKPESIFANYYCCAKNRVACRRWINGPKTQNAPWLRSCGDVTVFYMADGWAVTSRGFIQTEWLEVG